MMENQSEVVAGGQSSHPSDTHVDSLRIRWTGAAVLVAVGVGVLFAAYLLRKNTYWLSVLTEVGGAIVLLAPLLVAERYLARRIQRAQATTDRSVAAVIERVERVEDETARLKTAVGTLSERSAKAVHAQREEYEGEIRDLEEDFTGQNVFSLMEKAKKIGAISEAGVRIAPEYGIRRIRFITTYDHIPAGPFTDEWIAVPQLFIRLESSDGDVIETHEWTDDSTFDDLVRAVIEMFQRARDFSPSVDYGKLFRDLKHTVEMAVRNRLENGPVAGPFIELPNEHWAVTDFGLEAVEVLYQIPQEKLWSPDWISHMDEKTWVDMGEFRWALEEAKQVFPRPPRTFLS